MSPFLSALMDPNQRRAWLDRQNEAINKGLAHYLGPAARPVQQIGGLAAMMSPGADMMDMVQSGGDLMASRDPMSAAQNAGWLGLSTLGMVLPGNVGAIKNLKGEKVTPPTRFYRGTNPGDTRRIKTGADEWESHLFMADNPKDAGNYGSHIDEYEAEPGTNVLFEGTAEWNKVAGKWRKDENMLQYADRASKAAKAAGYDAAWFKRQGDIGTAVFNRDKFKLVTR